MSRYHFLRTFRTLIGMTPHQFLLRTRMHRAATMLRQSDHTIASVAFDAGFGDLSTFNRRFRQVMGASPGAYRVQPVSAGFSRDACSPIPCRAPTRPEQSCATGSRRSPFRSVQPEDHSWSSTATLIRRSARSGCKRPSTMPVRSAIRCSTSSGQAKLTTIWIRGPRPQSGSKRASEASHRRRTADYRRKLESTRYSMF